MSKDESTKIDLGDDLVEKTAIIPGHPSAPGTPDGSSSDGAGAGSSAPLVSEAAREDRIQSARILMSEGFPEEAKKALRQILVSDPNHRESRKLLDEIHESELKQMFSPAETVVRKSLLSPYDESILGVSTLSNADSEEIIRLLDRDVHLGLKGAAQEISFFSDKKLLDGFASKLEREAGDSPSDRVDLAIGFIEMGLHPVAIRLLQPLVSSEIERDRLNAVALIAYARILAEENYEAISALQPVLNDNDLAKQAKTEIFYLMGRALQALAMHAEAIGWFMQARENEPGYRDSSERIARSEASLGKKR